MKKFLALLCMITCVFGLTACGSEKEMLEYDATAIDMVSEFAYSLVSQEYDEQALAEIKAYDQYAWDEIEAGWRQYGLKIEGRTVIAGIESYQNALSEIGDVVEVKETTVTADADSLVAITNIDGSLHDAEIEILFDKDLKITSISTNVQYSFKEQMGKAGLNTLLGMGTVFAVLILIMFIISLFKYISKMEKAMADKKNNNKANAVDNTIAQIIEKEEEELSDDFELVAVIAAAVATYEGAASADGFVVRSIRKHK